MKGLSEWFTGGRKAALGGCLLVVGLFLTVMTKGSGDAGYLGYLLFTAGVACMWNTLLSKINHCNINVFLYELLTIVPVCVFINLMNEVDGSMWIGIAAICMLIHWVGSVLLIHTENVFKRIMMGFFSLLLNIVSIVVLFVAIASYGLFL